jgi:hypothetical protein
MDEGRSECEESEYAAFGRHVVGLLLATTLRDESGDECVIEEPYMEDFWHDLV